LKILFDQNISPKIIKLLELDFPGSKQVRHLRLENATDIAIFEYAKKNGFAIATFDSNFVDLTTLRGVPPKVIWLRTGNLSTLSISALVAKNKSKIENFLNNSSDEILELTSF